MTAVKSDSRIQAKRHCSGSRIDYIKLIHGRSCEVDVFDDFFNIRNRDYKNRVFWVSSPLSNVLARASVTDKKCSLVVIPPVVLSLFFDKKNCIRIKYTKICYETLRFRKSKIISWIYRWKNIWIIQTINKNWNDQYTRNKNLNIILAKQNQNRVKKLWTHLVLDYDW